MTIYSDNLRFLRTERGCSQQKLADELIVTRESLAKYEYGKREPSLVVLQRISHYFHISIDIMISVDLKKTPLSQLLKLEDNRILFPITVDRQGKDNIEIVPLKAKAGYLRGYSDPSFIEGLQHIALPFLTKGKYRAFPIEGDSMPPHREGSFIVGRYLEKLSEIKDGKTYIILSKDEGIVYKRVFKKNKKDQTLILHSDNPVYKPYELSSRDVLEVWEHASSISTRESQAEDLNHENLRDMFRQLRIEIKEIKDSL